MPEEARRLHPGKRIRGKLFSVEPPRASWSEAWELYVRGNVVTEHARRIITNFLTATLARTAAQDESDEEEDAAATTHKEDVERYNPTIDELHSIIRTCEQGDEDDGEATRAKQEQVRMIRRARSMWSSQASIVSEDCQGLSEEAHP